MIRRKICLLGGFAVGKTSLAARFMERPFTGRYLTTIGVRVDRKVVEVSGREILLLIWDLAGEDRFQRVEPAYLRGSSGYLLVVDGTRRRTLDEALLLHERARAEVGSVPFSLLLNKADLESEWDLDQHALVRPESEGWRIFRTSALSGVGVESALQTLAVDMLDK
jgi:small GTP-binding protein